MKRKFYQTLAPVVLIDKAISLAFRLGCSGVARGILYWCKGGSGQELVRYEVPQGPIMYLNPHNFVDSMILSKGQHDAEVIDALRTTIRKGDVFWDVGANIGFISLSLLRDVSDVHVVAFEPSPFTIPQLYANKIANQVPITIVNKALFDVEGTFPFSIKVRRNTGQSTLRPDPSFNYDVCFDVICVPGDLLIDRGVVPAPTVMKIDVEGAEYQVLKGLRKSLRTMRAIIFEGPTKDHDEILKLLSSNGFAHIKRLSDQNQSNYLALRESLGGR